MKKVFENLPRIETERLILRPVEDKDWKAVFEYASDPETAEYTSWEAHKYPEESKQHVAFIRKRYKANKPSNWAIVRKSDNKMIGMCGYVSEYRAHKLGEMGYVIRKDCRNMGYATEAAKKAVEFGFKELGYNRIEAYCDAENTASAKVLEKCGMKFEGTFRQSVWKGGRFRDKMCFAVLAEEYWGEGQGVRG